MWYNNQRRQWLLNLGLKRGGGKAQIMNRKCRWKGSLHSLDDGDGLQRRGQGMGEKGLELFVGSAKQMARVPAGKRLLWALCLSNIWTQCNKGREVGMAGGPEAALQPLRAREDTSSPQQHGPCQRMPVIRSLAEVIPRLSPALQQASLLSGKKQGRRPKGGREALGRWCLFSARPYESSLPLFKHHNCSFLIFCQLLLTVVID